MKALNKKIAIRRDKDKRAKFRNEKGTCKYVQKVWDVCLNKAFYEAYTITEYE